MTAPSVSTTTAKATAVAPVAARYSPALIALHWGVVVMVVLAYATMELRGLAPRGAERDTVKMVHYWLGLGVLALAVARIVLRVRTPTPPINPPMPPHLKIGAVLGHAALYAFLIAMPFLGWASLSAEGAPITFLGIPLFPIAPQSETLVDLFEEAHEIIATLGYFLLGGHAAAALYHHYIRRDDTLLRMLPARHAATKPKA